MFIVSSLSSFRNSSKALTPQGCVRPWGVAPNPILAGRQWADEKPYKFCFIKIMTNSILDLKSKKYLENQRKLSKFQTEMRKNPTEAEILVKKSLEKIGVKFVFQKGFLREKTLRIVDFYIFSKPRICLEIDGKYHDNQVDYDSYREKMIKKQRKKEIIFIRLTNEWVMDQKNLVKKLSDLLNG